MAIVIQSGISPRLLMKQPTTSRVALTTITITTLTLTLPCIDISIQYFQSAVRLFALIFVQCTGRCSPCIHTQMSRAMRHISRAVRHRKRVSMYAYRTLMAMGQAAYVFYSSHDCIKICYQVAIYIEVQCPEVVCNTRNATDNNIYNNVCHYLLVSKMYFYYYYYYYYYY